jgi:hypothetical protein
MTKAEREKVREAIRLLNVYDGTGWEDGMYILMRLAGMDTSRIDQLRNAPTISVFDLHRQHHESEP